ncbi:xanthine dehydrogenase family protein molybdopterin-binding subunit [Indioceanicola profundi]|uniref:xanthine dehydrogenase family protein molybdopterin-binding subunit n=1 Tax=Indioceanicola profundi TaxID=2220096 RepID=UPI000E6AD76C|nr:molybdopterin cofactor-binding domain-containing protein [Indioceanicola profundi]
MATNDAAAFTRRLFLAGGGGLSFLIAAGGLLKTSPAHAARPDAEPRQVNAWVSIAPDGIVTIKLGSAEMGQGVMTALPLILAEELDADWTKVRVEPVTHDPDGIYGNPKTGGVLYTAGSSSVEGYFPILRRAGATARRVLIHSAARHWQVAPSEVTTRPGFILHEASGRRLGFGDVASLPEIVTDVPPVTDAELKPRAGFRLIGRDVGRLDVPAKTRGAAEYTIDVRVPGMLYAALLRAPVEGEAVAALDDAAATAIPGVVRVMALADAVAVLAEQWEIALAARDALKVEWTTGSGFRKADSDADLARDIMAAQDPGRNGVAWSSRGEPDHILAGASRVVEADYATDHVYHAQMEPLAAVAHVDADGKGAEIWIGTQSQTVTLAVATQVLGTTPDRIRFHSMQMGGAFGRRTFFARDLLRDALILSREAGRPVKLIWTREDDVANGWFRPATAHRLRAALNPDGTIAAWHHRVACPSIFGYLAPDRLTRAEGRDLLIMEGSDIADYAVPNLLAEHINTERRARLGAWRGIGWGHNLFASECFVEELARRSGTNSLDYRRQLLAANARGLALLEAVAAMSNFGSPPEGRAHGLAYAGYKGTRGAGVAEISLDTDTGQIRVHRFFAAVDAGIAVQPRNMLAQIEGGIIYGLSGLLKERITIKNGEVQQSNFYDYEILRADEVPEIEIRIIDSDAPPTGAGEIGVPMTGAAVANAFLALTGHALRHMPFTPDRVMQALNA